MNYVIAYFSIGLITYFIALIQRHKTESRGNTKDSPESLYKQPNVWSKKVIDEISGIILISFIWPVVIYWQISDKLSTRSLEEKKHFLVHSKDLLKKIDIDAIEHLEMVYDPLNAIPNKPFGHLNRNWIKFKQTITENDDIWSFSAQWTSEWGFKDQRKGYVIVNADKPGNFIITEIK